MEAIRQILSTLKLAEALKRELRHSWLSDGRQESVAEHTYQMALMALFIAPYLESKVNLEHTFKLILVHDLVEAVTGDIPFFEASDRKAQKATLESEAIAKIRDLLPTEIGPDVHSLWNEFETGRSLEAKFARALDNLEVQLQHNLASLETWKPIEHELVYTKMDKHCSHDSFLRAFCDAVKGEAELKLTEGGILVNEIKEMLAGSKAASIVTARFPIKLQKLDAYSSLGEGIWGSVFDLEDGTVLKLARERCAGIGSGREKIEREFIVLAALGSRSQSDGLCIPRALGHGIIPDQVHPDPTLWLHTTKVPGITRKVAELRSLSADATKEVASSIGKALWGLHRDLDRAQVRDTLASTSESLQTVQSEFGDDPQAAEFVMKIQKFVGSASEKSAMVIHGDFNISNILFEMNQVKSIVDFAETRCGLYEDDLASIITELPAFRGPMIAAFEEVSGYKVDDRRLLTAQAIFELFTFAISGRQKNMAERSDSQQRLQGLLEALA